jgi:TonB family protein
MLGSLADLSRGVKLGGSMSGRVLAALLLAALPFGTPGCGTTGGAQAPASGASAATVGKAEPESKRRVVVVLRLRIGDDGAVRHVQVVRSAGRRFDKAAARIASRAHFEPPREDGRPIESSVIVSYRFNPDATR